MVGLVIAVYGLVALIALTNLVLMERLWPDNGAGLNADNWIVLVPARDEVENLTQLLPRLQYVEVIVFDDESSDGTGELAKSLGATVLIPSEPLPIGWTGKNRACHELAKYALEKTSAEWLLFLDADARPNLQFVSRLKANARNLPPNIGVITGFPHIVPGRGLQPLALGWVGWILLSTNPYGLVNRSGRGHSMFTNGQVHAWRRSVYQRLWPNEAVKGRILEDVMMGRLCAKHGVAIQVFNMSKLLGVKMYETWQETLDGMSKNTFEITGSFVGSLGLAALLLGLGWGWLFLGSQSWIAYGLLVLSAVFCAGVVRGKPWGALLMPIVLTVGAYTVVRSTLWRMQGKVSWKGRTYPS